MARETDARLDPRRWPWACRRKAHNDAIERARHALTDEECETARADAEALVAEARAAEMALAMEVRS